MYDHPDYIGAYQGVSSFTDPAETVANEVQYQPSTSSFSSHPASYGQPLHDLDQQSFLSLQGAVTYQTEQVPSFPQHWLSTPDASLIEAQVDPQFHILPAPQQQELGQLTPWPSLPNSNSRSSEDGGQIEELDDGEERAPEDKKKERKERRRAQNRVAQRLFRARREVSLKESSQRLESLEDEVTRLQSSNEELSDTVGELRREIQRLKKENHSLRRRFSDVLHEEEEEEKVVDELPSLPEQIGPQESGARHRRGKEMLDEENRKAAHLARSNRERKKTSASSSAQVSFLDVPGNFP